MISDERLNDLINWVDSKDGDGREYPDDAVTALQELLDARQKIDKLKDAGNKLLHDVVAFRMHNGDKMNYKSEDVWDDLMREIKGD